MAKRLLKDKRVILFLSFLALFSLVLLASAIGDASFRPARHFSQAESEVIRIPVGEVIKSVADIPLEKQIAFLILLFLFGVLVASLLSPETRKRLLKQFLRLVLGALLLLYLLKLKPDLLEGLLPIFNMGAKQGALSQGEAIPPPVFEPPQVSGWLSFFVTLGIVLLAAVFLWRVNRWWMLHKEALDAPPELDEIAGVARTSLRELSSGQGSAQDKIIQCYSDMSRVLVARRGLSRDYAMTPSEFVGRLEKAGLPRDPVSRLTHLFESVRYGARISAQGEIDEAIACLSSILKYCGEALS
jgi:hypothetical protein